MSDRYTPEQMRRAARHIDVTAGEMEGDMLRQAAADAEALASERAKVRDLREWHRLVREEMGQAAIVAPNGSARLSMETEAEAHADALNRMDALGLTGEAQP